MKKWVKYLIFNFFSALKGLGLTGLHLKWSLRRRKPVGIKSTNYFDMQNGTVTVQYPREKIPVPDVGRYRLHLETEDCIGCDQCARICPVDCITIEKIKAPEVLHTTSDGTKVRFYLPTFDIDLAKCCYCGLCTVVCPTECLIMTPQYDFADYNRENFLYQFGNLTPEEARLKQAEIDAFEEAKKAAKAAAMKKDT